MLDQALLDNVRSIFANLNSSFVLSCKISDDKYGQELKEMCQGLASTSDKISVELSSAEKVCLTIIRDEKPTGIVFRGVPGGHEFTSLLLAILNADGQGKNLPDEIIKARIQALKAPIKITTYASLSCTNCPDVVQSLNLMALFNEGITHEMVDGAIYKDEVESLGISAVPTVYADGKELHIGKSTLGELLKKLEERYGSNPVNLSPQEAQHFDLIVIGGGPSGVSASLYSARKGLKVALIAERIGGQVNETIGIENIPSVPQTTGQQLAADLRRHAEDYPISIIDQRIVEKIAEIENGFEVRTSFGEVFTTDQLILSTGAKWRKLGVKGEEEYIGRGVAFCPHCDGPFFKGKDVAVIGGGNSGIEAAIDLAGICKKVTVLEFMPELKADTVLQKKARSLSNVEIITNVATDEILGDGTKVNGIRIKNRDDESFKEITLDGIFVQIGLSANTAIVEGFVERNKIGEILVDERCRTSKANVYAAGDCTTVPYKQIVIAMGEGAKAALTAFDDRIRGI